MNNNVEFSKMGLEIVSPVNIGNGTVLEAKEYIYDVRESTVYLLNQMAWHKFIYKHGLFNEYAQYMEKERRKTLQQWLKDLRIDIKEIIAADVVKSKIIADRNDVLNSTGKKGKKNTLNQLICQARLSDGRVYIPGSSLKGIFRSAMLFRYLKRNEAVCQSCWSRIKFEVNSDDRYKKGNAAELEKMFISSLPSAGKDIGISCSDTNGLNSSQAPVAALQKVDIVINQQGETKENPLSVFRESILAGAKFNFDLKINTKITEAAGIHSIDDLLEAVQDYFNASADVFMGTFRREKADIANQMAAANIYLGSNTGFLTKTLILALAPSRDEAREITSKILQKSFGKHKHDKDRFISPRSLKMTNYNNKRCLTGLARVYKA